MCPAAPRRTLRLIGCVVGTYRIEAMLGAGGMGEVFRAHDSKLSPAGRAEAASLLMSPPIETGCDGSLREARAVPSINHPNILIIHDFGGDIDGRPFIVSELVEGETLRERADARSDRACRWPWAGIGLQVTAALAATH